MRLRSMCVSRKTCDFINISYKTHVNCDVKQCLNNVTDQIFGRSDRFDLQQVLRVEVVEQPPVEEENSVSVTLGWFEGKGWG